MAGELYFAGYVLMPLGFGLVPGFLPRSVPLAARWTLWLALLALAAAYLAFLRGAAFPFPVIAFGVFLASALLSLSVLVAEARRGRRKTLCVG
jgi:hypothetical protein